MPEHGHRLSWHEQTADSLRQVYIISSTELSPTTHTCAEGGVSVLALPFFLAQTKMSWRSLLTSQYSR